MSPNLLWSRLSRPEASMQTATHGTIVVSIWQTMIILHGQLVSLAPTAVAVVVALITNLLFFTNIQAMLLQNTWCVARPTAGGLRHLIRQTQGIPVLSAHPVKRYPFPIFLHVAAYLAGYTPGASRNTLYHLLFFVLMVLRFDLNFSFCVRCYLFGEKSTSDTEEGKYRRVHVTTGQGKRKYQFAWLFGAGYDAFPFSLCSFLSCRSWMLRWNAVDVISHDCWSSRDDGVDTIWRLGLGLWELLRYDTHAIQGERINIKVSSHLVLC